MCADACRDAFYKVKPKSVGESFVSQAVLSLFFFFFFVYLYKVSACRPVGLMTLTCPMFLFRSARTIPADFTSGTWLPSEARQGFPYIINSSFHYYFVSYKT